MDTDYPVPPQPRSGAIGLAAALIAVAATVAYANTFSSPFTFDDIASIVENPTIRSLWPLGPVFSPPSADGATVGGRPFLNFTFAINHAIGGTEVGSYHVTNLIIHALAGLTLFGIVRRTMGLTRFAANAFPIALFSALLWTLHPLQTESVTYVVQRAESLNGLFYLLTLYTFIRATSSARSAGMVLRLRRRVLARRGDQGSDRDRAARRAALRPDLRERSVSRRARPAPVVLRRPGGHVAAVGVVRGRHGWARRHRRPRRQLR